MNASAQVGRLVAGLAATLLLAGCAASLCPTPGPAAPTAAPPAGSPSITPSASPAAAEAWDLVWFSDSSLGNVAELMAARIEETQGVEVRVHDFSGPAIRGSAVFIADMTEVEEVENALVDAEMIVLYANPAGTEAGDKVAEACLSGDPTPRDPPAVYAAGDFAPFAERLRFIYDRIFELRANRPVILRAVDLDVSVIAAWRKAGIEPACTASWQAWTSVARETAARYGVPMASMYDAFNGPAHDEDPVANGYISADGAHPSDAGRAVQVDVIDALGYQPVNP